MMFPIPKNSGWAGRAALIVLVSVVSACVSRGSTDLTLIDLAYKARAPESGTETILDELESTDGPGEMRVLETPTPPFGSGATTKQVSGTFPELTGDPVGLTLNSMPLPAFVNTVFGEILRVDFEIDPSVLGRQELITLRTSEDRPPMEFFQMVISVLQNYALGVRYDAGIYRIVPSEKLQAQVPRIIRTRAYSDIPRDLRPIFQFVPLGSIRKQIMQDWIRVAFKTKVLIHEVASANALILIGTPQDVDAVLESIKVLDQPYFAGQRSVRIEPVYWGAAAMVRQLSRILTAEGYYTVTTPEVTGAITFLTLDTVNAFLVFTVDEKVLNHVVTWAAELDSPGRTGDSQGLFYYQVRNTDAGEIAAIVGALEGEAPVQTTTRGQQNGDGASSDRGLARVPRKIVVDGPRNGIIFKGSAEEYARLRQLFLSMDHAPLEVLIVATIAEVTLEDQDSLGIDWALNTAGLADSTTGRLAGIAGGAGLNFTIFDSARQVRAMLDAFALNSNVSILSSPRLVAKSGTTASISIGTEIPVVTTQQTDPTGQTAGTSNILQQIQFRSTGVLLSISPIVYSGKRVELTISQEVSEAGSGTGAGGNPIILNRNINTTLTLNDGQTALLGGLISENVSQSDQGVPFLKDIPIIGHLFKSSTASNSRTELMVLITPYIIESPAEAAEIRDAFRRQLSPWAQSKSDNIE